MKKLKRIGLIAFVIAIWTVFIGYGFIEGFLLRPLSSSSSTKDFVLATEETLKDQFVGNYAMVLIEHGEVVDSLFYSKEDAVTSQSLFPAASISKWVTSFGVLKLVEDGKLDLDQPIDQYLTRWHLPESGFDNQKVTARKLLSHSSGLIDDLGYNGFSIEEDLQTIEASLDKAADTEYSDGVAIVGFEPGSQYMYSGAGFTILQLVIEELSGQSFSDYMEQQVFSPLGMKHSTFEYPDNNHPLLVDIYTTEGATRPMNRFTALAAAGLYTTTKDLSKFLKANLASNPVLSQATLDEMTTAETFINTVGVYGLGPHLYSQNDTESLVIGHDGSGNDAINTAARIDLKSKSGIIVLETGHWNIASSTADEWLFWTAGVADYVVMQRNKPFVLTLWAGGALFILIASRFLIRKPKQ